MPQLRGSAASYPAVGAKRGYKRTKGARAMADPGGQVDRSLREGSAEIRSIEVRIVTESAFSSRRAQDDTLSFAAPRDFSGGILERGHGDVPSGSGKARRIRAPGFLHSPHQHLVVRFVESFTGQIRASGPALADHARLTGKHVHNQAGIIRERRHPTRQLKEVACLR